jgi:DNA-binding NarL/FixJ family response regulator
MAKRVVIIDDHPIVRDGIAFLLSQQKDLICAGEAGDQKTALELIESVRPDIVVLDIALGKENGLSILKQLTEEKPQLPVVILSMHDELLYAERCLRSGARGYVMKHEAGVNLIEALRKVLSGELAVSPKIATQMLESITQRKSRNPDPMSRLSDRELEVLRLIGAGLAVRDIAKTLFVSTKTVESHQMNIRQKLGLKSSRELVVYAVNQQRA